jgi:hypothetical protein
MNGYAAKSYWPGLTGPELRAATAAAARVADAAREARCLGSIWFPDDDLVVCLFAAASAQPVMRASARAGIPYERVMASVWQPAPKSSRR